MELNQAIKEGCNGTGVPSVEKLKEEILRYVVYHYMTNSAFSIPYILHRILTWKYGINPKSKTYNSLKIWLWRKLNKELSQFFQTELHGSVKYYVPKEPRKGYLDINNMLRKIREKRECILAGKKVGNGYEKELKKKRKRKSFRERVEKESKKVLKREKFNLNFRCARRIVKYTNLYYSREYLADLVRFFDNYLENYQDHYLVLRNSFTNDYLIKEIVNRFTDRDYFGKVSREFKRLYRLIKKYRGYGLFLTITVDPSQWKSTMEMVIAIKKFLDYLRRLIYDVWKYTIYEKRPRRKRSILYQAIVERKLRVTKVKPRYVAVLEFTKSGIPHLHILFFGIKFFYKPLLSEIMERLGIGIVCWVEKFELKKVKEVIKEIDIHNDGDKDLEKMKKKGYTIIDYILKYIGKVVNPESDIDEDIRYIQYALYWACNVRFFSNSRGLIKLNRIIQRDRLIGKWEYQVDFYLDDETLPIPLELVPLEEKLKAYYSYENDLDYGLIDEFVKNLRKS